MQEKEPVSPMQHNPMEETVTYRIEGRSFVVQSVFKKENANTLGEILLRLMQAEREKYIKFFLIHLTTAVGYGIIISNVNKEEELILMFEIIFPFRRIALRFAACSLYGII